MTKAQQLAERNALSIDARITGLAAGRRVSLSFSNGIEVYAERSGDGKITRIVRDNGKGFSVIKTILNK